LPLRSAIDARRGSRALLAARTEFFTKSQFEGVYKQLRYDPRPVRSLKASTGHELPGWLRPLAGDVMQVFPDDAIREIWLNSDTQALVFCENADSFLNLERLAVTNLSPAMMDTIDNEALHADRVIDLEVNNDMPKDWLKSLPYIRTLFLSAEGRKTAKPLTAAQLHDVAAMPELKILWIFQYPVTDADVSVLSESKTLRYIFFKRTAVTEAGVYKLSEAMPDCVIRRD